MDAPEKDVGVGDKEEGRPRGSINKSKDEPSTKRPKKSSKERGEEAARCNLDDDSVVCPLCTFRFDDPIKKDKTIARCTVCRVNLV